MLITAGASSRQHLEQPTLGREVVVHARVEVEMVARQVREDAGGEPDAVNPSSASAWDDTSMTHAPQPTSASRA